MAGDIIKFWDATIKDVPSASVPQLITVLHGGESITIKSLAGSGKAHYIGSSRKMTTTVSYTLDVGETMTISLPMEFGVDNKIEIWALAEVAGEDICYFKVFGVRPSTEAST